MLDHVPDPRAAAGANRLADPEILFHDQDGRTRVAEDSGGTETGGATSDDEDIDLGSVHPPVPSKAALRSGPAYPTPRMQAGNANTSTADPPGRRRGSGFSVPRLPSGRAGDPGLFGPSSIVWRVNRERVLVLSAPAVAILQLAHPLVAAAVAEHTDRRRTAAQRLVATVGLNLAVIFGDREQAEQAALHVRDLHTRISGRLGPATGSFPAGSPYRADDPELLRWGHATIVWAGIGCYTRFVEPLSPVERDRYVADVRPFGAAFGLDAASLPSTFADLQAYVFSMVVGDALVASDDGLREANQILWPRASPGERATGPSLRIVTAGLLPEAVRRGFALPSDGPRRVLFSSLAGANRIAVRTMPPGLRWWPHYRIACARVGGA